MYRHRVFVAALVAAPVVWIFLYWWLQPAVDFSWPLHAPARYLLFALVYPVLEEIVFRGALQGWLRERAPNLRSWQGVTLANLYTSIIFTALHFISHPPLWAAAVFVPSIIFGYFRDRYGRVGPSIALHAIYNAGFFLLFGV